MIPGVTIVVPGIINRAPLIGRGVMSVLRQTWPVASIQIAIDLEKRGGSFTRNRGLAKVDTDWTGFLDDDDELYPWHCETLLELAQETGAGVVWGWFDVTGGHDPFPENRGRQWTEADPFTVPITYLVRTELLHQAVVETGGFLHDTDATGAWDFQDKAIFEWMAINGGCAATDVTTWRWSHHGFNTSGLGAKELAMRGVREEALS